MHVLYTLDFTHLTDEQERFVRDASPDELRLMVEHHGAMAALALEQAAAWEFAVFNLLPWLRDPLGRDRTLGQALDVAPGDLADAVVRRFADVGIDLYPPDGGA